MFDWAPKVIGTAFSLGVPAEKAAAFAEIVDANSSQEDPPRRRFRADCANGTSRWTESATRLVRDAQGAWILALVSVRDISAQVAAETVIAERQLRLSFIRENASLVAVDMAPDLTLRWVSPSVTAVLGWGPADLVGLSAAEIVHPDDEANLIE